ncbi:MAG TPA: ABC transporter substrate-binding protein, partial [Burkholderiales bacterium]|nr:ABC transporter substrate-binding protein [Burkholderiales bacterium]
MQCFLRRLVGFLTIVLLWLPPAADAQRSGKPFHVGHLSGSGAAANKTLIDAFKSEMRSRGYVEGQNLVLDERYADGKFDRLPVLVQELIQLKPDVLLVATTPGNLAAKAATATVPIVFVLVADPVGAGIVASLARQGGNITGVTNIVAELGGKRLEIMKEFVPKATRIGVMVNPNDQNTPLQMRYAEEGARRLGIKLEPVLEVRTPDDLERAFDSAAKARVPAVLRMIDPLVFMLRKQTAALSVKYRVPMIYPAREDVENGGLVAYGANAPEQFRQAAVMVDKILRGAKPADLPVEQPTKFDLVINAKTARALNLPIPPPLVLRGA